jgi:predicted 3-demethylubiquinone-9 3-methyltransferase (glyoxalase superfamily)
MATNIRTHLTFDGTAEAAMNFYVDLFPNSEVIKVFHYDEGESKGKIQQAFFTLGGREFICIDTPIKHDWGFTPAVSIFVDCESEEELERLYSALAADGKILMPLDNWGFSQRFGWVSDRFGVSWQLNLP